MKDAVKQDIKASRHFRTVILGLAWLISNGPLSLLVHSADIGPTVNASQPASTRPSTATGPSTQPATKSVQDHSDGKDDRSPATRPSRHFPTTQEAKTDIERQIERKLGRPLSEAETEMIDVTEAGEKIHVTIHQPLTGRLMKAIHDAKAATKPSNAD